MIVQADLRDMRREIARRKKPCCDDCAQKQQLWAMPRGAGGPAVGTQRRWSPGFLSTSQRVAWFRADLGAPTTTNGGTFNSWVDQYGLRTTMNTAASPTLTALSTAASRRSVTFNGSQFLQSASDSAWGLTSAYSIWLVWMMTTANTFNTLISKGVTTAWDHYVTGGIITSCHSGTCKNSGGSSLTTNTWYLINLDWNGTNISWSVNGTAQTGTTALGAPSTSTDSVKVGQRQDASTSLTGQLAEVLVLSSALSATDLGFFKGYIRSFYNMTIA